MAGLFEIFEGSGSFSPTTHPEQSEGSLVNFPKEPIEILQPFGLQDEESGNSPTPQLIYATCCTWHVTRFPPKADPPPAGKPET